MEKKCFMALYGPLESDARVLRSINCLTSQGYQITICTCNTKKSFSIGHNVNIVNTNIKQSPGGFLYFNLYCLIKYWKHRHFTDFIYLHDYFSVAVGCILSLVSKKPILYDAHELILPMKGEKLTMKYKIFVCLEKILVHRVEYVIEANSERRDLIKSAYGLNNVTYVMNISSVKYLHYSHEFKPEDKIKLVYQGVVSKSRNLDFFILSLEKLPSNINMVIIGDGDGLIRLKDLAIKKNLSDRVEFKGRMENDKMMTFLKSCHIGLISYPFHNFNNIYCSPNKIFEYASLSLPFVSTNQPFIQKIEREYKVGATYEYNDTESFCKTVLNVISNYSQYCKGFNQFLTDYNIDKEQDRLKSLINSLWSQQ